VCPEGDQVWLSDKDDVLSAEPYYYNNDIFEGSGSSASLDGPQADVCAVVAGDYVKLYSIHFWAKGAKEIKLTVHKKNGVLVPGQVRILLSSLTQFHSYIRALH
jgi:hypothetical protein